MKSIFILFIFSALVSLSTQTTDSKDLKIPPSSAHARLANYGFPFGLLPSSVVSYTINDTSGDFSLDLGDSCKFTLPPDNYVASFSRVVTGKIAKGRIHSLDGIRVRALFQWWSITGIRSSGDDLVFEVGLITAKYPSKSFNESPACEGRRSAS
ncbi:uncharacterized protein LOC111014474 [Momordica charantia]|uniref:Uncharacterized protein LOC111014474 n=1 Tax=Momordica charantia TaxID=3673 RepID=A0A6J1CSY8_MOMCH|nr:uncharacterized protein LOC111014474 [Momordica charantia]